VSSARVVSIQVGRPRAVAHDGGTVTTAIWKDPVEGPVRLGRLGFAGDASADTVHHGGVDQAAYAYPIEHYAFWEPRLGARTKEPGLFGENLTIEGLLESDIRPDDVLRVGGATVRVTSPRSPCYKLGLRTGDPGIVGPFLASGRLGFYLAVVEEGEVTAGDPIAIVERAAHGLRFSDFIEAIFSPDASPALIERALAVPSLHPVRRDRLRARLEGRPSPG